MVNKYIRKTELPGKLEPEPVISGMYELYERNFIGRQKVPVSDDITNFEQLMNFGAFGGYE